MARQVRFIAAMLLVSQGLLQHEARAEERTDAPQEALDADVRGEEPGAEPIDDAAERAEAHSDERGDDAPEQGERTPKHWQLGIAINAITYQLARFDVEPINSGARVPGTLDRTNYGPSGGPVLIEASYVLFERLALGVMLDVGSGLNTITVERLGTNGFQIEQSTGSFAVGPRVAYYFFPESALRPFGTLAFGYTKSPSKQLDQALQLTVYQGFAGAGLSYFLSSAFSLDTSVRAAYGIGSGYFLDNGILQNAGLSGSVFTLMWVVGTSGWL